MSVGPILSEIKYLGSANEDFIEISVPAGYDVSDLELTIYNSNGTVRTFSDNIDDITPNTIAGRDVYVILNGDATAFNGVAASNAVALSENGTVHQFVSFTNTAAAVTATEGPANTLTSTEIGQAGAGSSLEADRNGENYAVQNNPTSTTVPCLTRGTLIETKAGLVKVEDLVEGAKVRVFGDGFKPLRKVFKRRLTRAELNQNPKLFPVKICAGTLGPGVPEWDMHVSRQHRMLVTSIIAKRMFGDQDALVSAVKLTEIPGIFIDQDVPEIEYFHLLFDRHEVIFANGAPTESFLLGPQAMRALPVAALEELQMIYPDLKLPQKACSSDFLIPAGPQQAKLVSRHAKNKRPLVPTV